ncbi:midasin-like isoform X2 [Juglans regia]|uniref:peptidylprolyl isomerase n=1 Tax=Juglans regia TaxID=51240 RepID=A0A6P9EXF9_JUGRE|nr:midasin-like isoform X2 [Juglans regia]
MAFWGIEVKPGKPFTHEFDELKGRLHISMATLALGTATAKSVLQCNVGNRSPVYLCALYPVSAESVQLNLEFEEADDVVFSVLGPRSVFLTGYYMRGGQHDSEPCGEDIVDTETERSEDSDEDDYEDSFIDDDDPEVYPPSLISDGGVVSVEMLDSERPKHGKGSRRRLRKRYQMSESEEEGCSQEKNIVNGRSGEPEFESEDEDSIPISSFYKSKTTAKKTKEEVDRDDKEMSETSKKNTEDEGNYVSESTRKAGNVVNGQQKSIIEKSTEEVEVKTHKGTGETSVKEMEDGGNYTIQTKREVLDAFIEGETKTPTKKTTEEVLGRASKGKGEISYKETEDDFNPVIEPKRKADGLVDGQPKRQSDMPINCMPSSEGGPENGIKPKKKRKDQSKEEKPLEADSDNCSYIINKVLTLKDEARTDNIGHDLVVKDGQGWKEAKAAEVMDTVLLPSSEDGGRPKKKRKERPKEGKNDEAECKHGNVVKEDKTQKIESNTDYRLHDFPLRDEANDQEAELPENLSLPFTEVGSEVGEKPKKKRKQQASDTKISKADSKHDNVLREDRAQQNEPKADDIVCDLPMEEQNQYPDNLKCFESSAHEFADDNHSEGKNIKKKKKKKSKTKEKEEAVNMNITPLPMDKIEDKKMSDKSSQIWTLSNGLIIEVLEMGKPDSKVAASGKRVSINYDGKLKKNGESFDSNVGCAPYKFRIGLGEVIGGWDIGLDGMRVGEKRRLTIPPSLGFGSARRGENVPPDSWLVYDIELVKVH